ncbi:DUF6511 domain-containing protein [Methylococcus mesophilus]|uniref:DUF6511 domain-containing protein n=1 Tax=Methylococcus mesophilus TaxID=2993564 RepID=UPI00224B2250|nr:DUF6511 domain-containing protein [Methylococcus mesophilus]UZR28115.1 DUF6511 domain-containing protein [Methylococcus mesophilus]
MICAICGREGRGFCWASSHDAPRDSGGKRLFKRFCSRRCQDIHLQRLKRRDGVVIDPTHNEKAAMEAVLPRLGDYVAAIGMDRPLSAYSRAEILQLVDVVLTAYFDHLREHDPDDVPF